MIEQGILQIGGFKGHNGMKINVNQIPDTGLELEEALNPKDLGLEADNIRFNDKIKVRTRISKSINTLIVNTRIETKESLYCSRCLKELELDLAKDFNFNYALNKQEPIIDITEDIRQELILSLPVNPLCRRDCKGLCAKCGKNLNEGECNCVH